MAGPSCHCFTGQGIQNRYSFGIMVSSSGRRPWSAMSATALWLRGLVRRQFITRNRRMAAVLAVAVVGIGIAAVQVSASWFSPGLMILPILAGGRAKLGLLGLRGDQMLVELRDRIRAQSALPTLPEGWGSESVLRPAGGASFGGDFVVSVCDGKMLEVAVVDVSGKGIDAGTRALLLSGAFGGLLGSVPASAFLSACNAYLRRAERAEGFVTAVHLALDLTTGSYVIGSAGHPPAAHFESGSGRWRLTQARGIVLGVVPDLREGTEQGMLRPRDALMLYTDGLVEVPGRDIDVGIDRLLGEADQLVTSGFRGGAARLVQAMQDNAGATDDRALVLIWRA